MPTLLTSFKVIGAALASLIGAGGTYQYIGTKLDEQRYLPIGKMVDVGGYKLHMIDQGTGGPTVVMDSGVGSTSLDWSLVQPEIAKFTRVISYDRAGYSWSDRGSLARTSNNIVEELHKLLKNAGVPGPYIFMGHSSGGINVRLYASVYPDEVAGMVLIDSPHEDELKHSPKPSALLTSALLFGTYIGLLRLMFNYLPQAREVIKKYTPEVQAMYFSQKCTTKFVKTLSEEGKLFEKSCDQLKRADELLNDKPLVVITAGKKLTKEITGDRLPQEQLDGMNAAHQQGQKDLVTKSSRGKQFFAENSGHLIPYDQPEIIIKVVRDMVSEYNSVK